MPELFSELLEQVRNCQICTAHLPFAPKPILQFNPAARILIAGQAPGSRTYDSGIPFDDPSGERLRRWMGIDRNQFYNAKHIAILPMGFCYPGTGKSGDLAPRPECAEHWRKQLLAQLPNIELTLLIGQYAQSWHLSEQRKKTLTETVKAWQQYWPKYLPLPHPSPRNNRWLKLNPWFEQDVIPELQQRIADMISL